MELGADIATVFLFSGQGSQYFHMGKELMANDPIFVKWMRKLDNHAVSVFNTSIIKKLYDSTKGIRDVFEILRFSHPAIFMVQYALAQSIIAKGIHPDFLLGASLGEFVALTLAGILSLEEAFNCVINQALLFEEKCPPGGMIAVIGKITNFQLLFPNCSIAGINHDTQFVISGNLSALSEAERILKKIGIFYQVLPVRIAFHSPEIDKVEKSFRNDVGTFTFNPPTLPLISSSTAGKWLNGSLWDIVRKPIYFQKAIQFLEQRGNYRYIDVGPSGTLSSFVKKNLTEYSSSLCYSIMTPFHKDVQALKKLLS